LLKTSGRLTSSQKIFFAELAGTFIVVLCATGSVVIDSKLGGALGLSFVAFAPLAGVAAMVYAFGKISMAHFNPAVTIGFLVSGHIKRSQLPVYLGAEIIGAMLASLSVLLFIGSEANLGANAPSYSFPLPLIFGIEVLVTAFLRQLF
jgi:aquaporin Z